MSDQPLPQTEARHLKRGALVVAAVFLAILAVGIASRLSARAKLREITAEAAIPSANLIQPKASQTGALVLPGRLRAWSEAPVYARTNGYLKAWYADIGAHVKAGQLLAEIDTPEVDQQLDAAKAALQAAVAQRDLAAVTTKRWDRLITQNAVSQQEADERRGNFAAREANLNEAKANLGRLMALTGFKRVVAPFDGVVTSRVTDVGALIVAGDARSTPLFTVSDVGRLRLYVSVPQTYAGAVHPGGKARFEVPDHPDEIFTAEVVTTSRAVDAQSGAMLAQLVFDNTTKKLKPGGYAEVTLDLPAQQTATTVRIPASALLFRKEGTAVAVVDERGKVTIRSVQIARDDGAELEIGSGLAASEWIINSPSDAIETGDEVRPLKAEGAAGARS